VPLVTIVLQSIPQLIPVALTAPLPLPALSIVNEKVVGGGAGVELVVAHSSFEYPETPWEL
jgi:hypothetical protein